MIKNIASTEGEIDISKIGPQSRASAHHEREQAEKQALRRPDGRDLRRKNRTENLSFKVRMETVKLIQGIARSEGISMVETLERALALLDKTLKGQAGEK
jgi:hypothetical protein